MTLRGCCGSQGLKGASYGACCTSGNNCERGQVEGQACSRPGSRGMLPMWSCMVGQAQGDTGIEFDSQEGLGSGSRVKGLTDRV